jgi:flagellar protein FliS
MTRAASRYQAMDLQGMSGPQLVVFLYSSLLASLRQAHRAIEAAEHESRCRALCRARDIVCELAFSLDRAAGGPLAENLASLYEYAIREITQVDLHPDAARLARLTGLIASLHEAWQSAAAQVAETEVAAAARS